MSVFKNTKFSVIIFSFILTGSLLAGFIFIGSWSGVAGASEDFGTSLPREMNDADSTPTNLKVTLLDQSNSKTPIKSAYIFLYESDNLTISRTIETDSDGVADFGIIDRKRITLGIAYEFYIPAASFKSDQNADTETNERTIRIFTDVLAGDIIYLTHSPQLSGESSREIDININWVPAAPIGLDTAAVNPILSPCTWPCGFMTNRTVYHNQLHDNGQISLFAEGYSAGLNRELLHYGYLKDQNLVDGETYNITADKSPVSIPWQISGGDDELENLLITGEYHGTEYVWDYQIGTGPGGSINSVDFSDFGMESCMIRGDSAEVAPASGAIHLMQTYIKSEKMPALIDLEMSDIRFDSIEYNSASRSLSWSCSGTSDKDVIIIVYNNRVTNSDGRNSILQMHLYTNELSQSCLIPGLPYPVIPWIDTVDYDKKPMILARNVNTFAGYDEYWRGTTNGDNILDIFQTIQDVRYLPLHP